jgi:hypothetical protein
VDCGCIVEGQVVARNEGDVGIGIDGSNGLELTSINKNNCGLLTGFFKVESAFFSRICSVNYKTIIVNV